MGMIEEWITRHSWAGPVGPVTMIAMQPSYMWDGAREVFVLIRPDLFPRLSKSRLPTPSTRAAVEAEERRRAAVVGSLRTQVDQLRRQRFEITKRIEEAKNRLVGPRFYRWKRVSDGRSIHTFQTTIRWPDASPFPHSDDADSLRTKTLISCDSPHCSERSGSFASTDDEIAVVATAFEKLQSDLFNLRHEEGRLEQAMSLTSTQLAQAEELNRSPVAVSAGSFPRGR